MVDILPLITSLLANPMEPQFLYCYSLTNPNSIFCHSPTNPNSIFCHSPTNPNSIFCHSPTNHNSIFYHSPSNSNSIFCHSQPTKTWYFIIAKNPTKQRYIYLFIKILVCWRQIGVSWAVTKYWAGVGWAVTKYWVGGWLGCNKILNK